LERKEKKSDKKLEGHAPFIPKLHGNLILKIEDKSDSSASDLELHEKFTGKICASPLGCHGCLETLPADTGVCGCCLDLILVIIARSLI
jgi:hypothetical protein